jgi:two-component system cell cycle sensor histidine kinase/response regulator CckA
MTSTVDTTGAVPASLTASLQPWPLFACSGVVLGVAILVPSIAWGVVALGAAAGLFAAGGLIWAAQIRQAITQFFRFRQLRRFLADDPSPAFLTDRSGRLLFANTGAVDFGAAPQTSIASAFGRHMASADGLVSRIAAATALKGTAIEDVQTRDCLMRIRARAVTELMLILRVETLDRASALDIVSGSVPAMSLAKDGTVEHANLAAQELDGNERTVEGSLPVLAGHNPVVLEQTDGLRDVIYVADEQETKASRERPISMPIPEVGVLGGLPVPVLEIAVDGAIISANSPARQLLSLSSKSLPPLYDLVEGMGRPISEWLADAAAGRGLLKSEFVRANLPGKELYLQISLGRVFENGQIRLVGILNDATELKTLEAQFVQSQKMQAIGQLAGGVAHDFNNLLTAISGHCDLLLLRHDESDLDFSDLMQISQNANRAASPVGQLLAFSRKQNLKPQPLDLRDTMSDLTHLLNRLVGEKVTLDLKIEDTDRVIRADRRQFEQVVMNLVVNARDAMPDGGGIEIRVRPEVAKCDFERDRAMIPAGNYIIVEITDQGQGIDPDKLPKIFEPFFTTKKTGEGTGLGLSTAYGIVKQTGGFIFAESEVGVGTKFTLFFPAHRRLATLDNEQEQPLPCTSARGEGIILLVEDEAPVRAFASRALRMRGYTVLEAENAEAALKMLENQELEIDIFVTDVIMPGLDGPTWVRQALKDRPDTRVVFVSGYAEESLAENQARVPNSVFLPKPFSLTQLTNVVQRQLS